MLKFGNVQARQRKDHDKAAKPNLGKLAIRKEKKADQEKPKQSNKAAKPSPKKLS